MNGPKTKPEAPPPKILQRDIRTVEGKIRLNKPLNDFRKTAQAIKTLQQPEDKQNADPEQYATDKAAEATECTTRKVSGKTMDGAKKTSKKGMRKFVSIIS